jgi:predicted nucleic acid-binding protein
VSFAFDTNVLAYAEGLNGEPKLSIARQILRSNPDTVKVIPVQVLGELFNVLTRKGKWASDAAGKAVHEWRMTYPVIETTEDLLVTALELAADHRLFIWDAVILAAAAEARCDLLLSEDFQDGFAWRGVTVVNPFAAKPHRLLTKLLRVKP